jgi:hypothetical protein
MRRNTGTMGEPMKSLQEKKMAAAMAAVAAYLQREEEAFQAAVIAAMTPPQPNPAPLPTTNLWGQSGRQGMMQLRNMMQIKAFHRF